MELNPGNARESRKARGHSTLFLLPAFFFFISKEHIVSFFKFQFCSNELSHQEKEFESRRFGK
jgi:hypothetical protein